MKNILIIFVLALFVVLGCGKTGNMPTSNQTSTNQATKEILPVKAEILASDYFDNEIAANDKYKDKILEVTGKVYEISEMLGQIQVDLEGKKESGINTLTIKCSVNESEKTAVAKLKKGQTVTLVGDNDGKTANLYVGLNNCRVK